ncbi:MAG: formyltetrahydrofolate deformylase [Chitinophagaceae bacterium]|nr:formyltetrahydrofolate deformylase [Chitinophagaceae bacterium]
MIIVIQCKDKTGLVAAISSLLAAHGANIVSMREHVDAFDNRFFVRIEVTGDVVAGNLQQQLQSALPEEADIKINPLPEKKIIVLVTKEYHCLGDILLRNHFKTLGAKVQCVIGNHPDLSDICKRFGIPFHCVTHEQRSKPDFEKALLDVISKYPADYLVLAKFMRILSPGFVRQFPMRIINIHHSFLPAFAGAHPYKQAYERGVKLIGATAHFVTDELDEGPIIAQQIIPVTHSFTPADMMRAGKEIEKAVLARALHLVFEDSVLVYQNKTIVFD